MVLAYRAWDSERCPSCSTFPNEWLDERGRVLIDPPYITEIVSCQGCKDLAEASDGIPNEADGLRAQLIRPPLHPAGDSDSA